MVDPASRSPRPRARMLPGEPPGGLHPRVQCSFRHRCSRAVSAETTPGRDRRFCVFGQAALGDTATPGRAGEPRSRRPRRASVGGGVGTRWERIASSHGISWPLVSPRETRLCRQFRVGTGVAGQERHRLRNRRSEVRILSGALELQGFAPLITPRRTAGYPVLSHLGGEADSPDGGARLASIEPLRLRERSSL